MTTTAKPIDPTEIGFPAANPEWPDYLKAIYLEGCKRIAKCREQIGPDGVCPIPFLCVNCQEKRFDLCMMTGDGVPLCSRCFEVTLKGLSNV